MKVIAWLSCAVAAGALTFGNMAAAGAASVSFDDGWREQRFSLFSSNDFAPAGNAITVRSDGTVSLFWTRLPPEQWTARQAEWQWQVSRSVPPTDLTQKGGDDRNLALYFVFLPRSVAERSTDSDITDLLDEPSVRVLMYVWGGEHTPGVFLPTPYLGEHGRTVIRQKAGTGENRESVNLADDYRRAFGEPSESLVGLALSADSDDTDSVIDARIERLRLLP